MRQDRALSPATRGNRFTRTRPGQAMVEMAIVIMILLSLTFGIADLGLYMYDFVRATNCVRESARRAVVRDPNAGSPPLCNGLSPQVPAGYMTQDAGTEVQVTLTKNHQWIAICYFVPGMSCTLTMNVATSMRMEAEPIV